MEYSDANRKHGLDRPTLLLQMQGAEELVELVATILKLELFIHFPGTSDSTECPSPGASTKLHHWAHWKWQEFVLPQIVSIAYSQTQHKAHSAFFKKGCTLLPQLQTWN